jgi:hypothetical protein
MAYGSRIIWFAITQIFVTDPFNFIVVLIFGTSGYSIHDVNYQSGGG